MFAAHGSKESSSHGTSPYGWSWNGNLFCNTMTLSDEMPPSVWERGAIKKKIKEVWWAKRGINWSRTAEALWWRRSLRPLDVKYTRHEIRQSASNSVCVVFVAWRWAMLRNLVGILLLLRYTVCIAS
jgi:hypothetical protein